MPTQDFTGDSRNLGTGTERIALVTGANKGIGFEIARQLGRRGMTVYVAARDRGRGSAAAEKLQGEGLAARFIELDVLREETIRQAAATIEAAHGRLDVLMNNAGIADREDGPPSRANLDAVHRTLLTNFVGPAAVAQATLPLLRRSTAGRIVNVSSELGSLAFNADPGWGHAWATFLGYNASKAALNMHTVQLAFELKDTPIKVNSAAPGYTKTDLNDNRGSQTVEEGAAEAVRLALLPADGPTGGFFSSSGPVPW
ncbi:MAG TPA: SDR family oxidoreductase [Planctomycetaceae bacterium]|jgi:NAD(P)-dependent dehydrogenase (short-subunit alcohol dehydrogenase family)|nr:SDR family oxidoreductase [Planctomycetaceae bacterium]